CARGYVLYVMDYW
nr:immunoglobulin heavy chain junction region [Mus musculus]MBK4196700.1 immunoglobulin heavy chain junction region [Mus musculus]